MSKIPNIISTKDLSYISDLFDWNLVASKELCHFAKLTPDEKIQELMLNLSQMHANHCRNLLIILQGGNPYEE